jgi:hypothetical protein
MLYPSKPPTAHLNPVRQFLEGRVSSNCDITGAKVKEQSLLPVSKEMEYFDSYFSQEGKARRNLYAIGGHFSSR